MPKDKGEDETAKPDKPAKKSRKEQAKKNASIVMRLVSSAKEKFRKLFSKLTGKKGKKK